MNTVNDDTPSAICIDCISDSFLREIVAEDGKELVCSECGRQKNLAIAVDELAELIGEILLENLVLGEEVRVFHDIDDDNGDWDQLGEPLSFHIQEVLGQYPSFFDELVEAVIDSEQVWPPDGEEAFFTDYSNYTSTPVSTHEFVSDWKRVQTEVSHKRRFFSEKAKSFFSSIFHDLDSLQNVDWEKSKKSNVVTVQPAGLQIFRCRKCDSQDLLNKAFIDPLQYVGPPSAEIAPAGRMNSEGIVVLYGALERETAIAELRPSLDGEVISVTFETNRELRILDFNLLESAISSEPLSYFDPEFNDKVSRLQFLRQLHALISRPVQPNQDHEYLITQTMSEFLNHVIEPSFDGLIFRSVQKQGGMNIVMFPDEDGSFPIQYRSDSFAVFKTKAIKYESVKRHLLQGEDGIVLTDQELDWY